MTGLRALVAAALAVTLAAALLGCGDGGGEVAADRGAGPPPPPAAAATSLWLSAEVVPPGPVELVAVLVDHGAVDATFGVAAEVEVWDGDAWVAHRRLSMCLDHWHCAAEPLGLDEDLAVPDIGLGPGPGPGGQGPVERFTTDGLEPGWYRITQAAGGGAGPVTAEAVVEVAEGAVAPAPLAPLDRPAISVAPALVPATGGPVTLSPLVPAPSGSQTAEDVEAATHGLAEVAVVETWDGSGWRPAGEVPLGPAGADHAAVERRAEVPPLPVGEHRLVRTGPAGAHVGRLWVVDDEVLGR